MKSKWGANNHTDIHNYQKKKEQCKRGGTKYV